MIIHVKGPGGSGKYNVIVGGLKALGVQHRIVNCAVFEPLMDMPPLLQVEEKMVVLAHVEHMRPDFREELMAAIEKCEDKTFWVLDTVYP